MKMFRPVRRKKSEINIDAAKQLLHTVRRGVLAVNGEDGYPYAMPLNFLYDEENGKIYFHGARVGYKIDAIRACDKVCFTVYGNEAIKDEKTWAPYVQSAVMFGRCRFVEDDAEKKVLLKRLAMKYFPAESIADEEIARSGDKAQVFEITIEHMTGKEVQER